MSRLSLVALVLNKIVNAKAGDTCFGTLTRSTCSGISPWVSGFGGGQFFCIHYFIPGTWLSFLPIDGNLSRLLQGATHAHKAKEWRQTLFDEYLKPTYFEEMEHEDSDDDGAEAGEEPQEVVPGHAAELAVQDSGSDHHKDGEEDVVDGTHLGIV